MKIIIDNPCHENWEAMTPNEKGAFCLSCQKTVIDFSVKTIEEIKNFFVELPKTESVCGRFKAEQLEDISFEHFFDQFRGWKFFQKAAIVAFFVFGFSLFGNAQISNQRHEPLMMKGEVANITPQDTNKIKPVVKEPIKVEPPVDIQTMGGVRYVPEHLKDNPKKDKLMGKPSVKYNRE